MILYPALCVKTKTRAHFPGKLNLSTIPYLAGLLSISTTVCLDQLYNGSQLYSPTGFVSAVEGVKNISRHRMECSQKYLPQRVAYCALNPCAAKSRKNAISDLIDLTLLFINLKNPIVPAAE